MFSEKKTKPTTVEDLLEWNSKHYPLNTKRLFQPQRQEEPNNQMAKGLMALLKENNLANDYPPLYLDKICKDYQATKNKMMRQHCNDNWLHEWLVNNVSILTSDLLLTADHRDEQHIQVIVLRIIMCNNTDFETERSLLDAELIDINVKPWSELAEQLRTNKFYYRQLTPNSSQEDTSKLLKQILAYNLIDSLYKKMHDLLNQLSENEADISLSKSNGMS